MHARERACLRASRRSCTFHHFSRIAQATLMTPQEGPEREVAAVELWFAPEAINSPFLIAARIESELTTINSPVLTRLIYK